jgi:asparagine synthase (glutamine-hydrolysing)
MCGIAGIYRPGGQVLREELQAMARALGHRGPDAHAVFEGGEVGFAHTRLKIVDLSERAAQPMTSGAGKHVLVFNGEIYNHRPLRRALEAKGVRFKSTSDTEVLIESFVLFGEQMMGRLEGMFAFAVWDSTRRRLVLGRDRAGEKPLFYLRLARGGVAFSSEIKALRAVAALDVRRDESQLGAFLVYGYVPAPRTFYQDVRQLDPAHVMTFEADVEHAPRRYWTPRFSEGLATPSYADAKVELRERMRDIVRDRLEADVPVGAFLSGGLDSATVVGVATRDLGKTVHTYSIGFDDPDLDESGDARLSARHLGSIHEEFIVSDKDVPDIGLLVHHHDGPFGDSSAIPTYLVSKLARSHVTVAVTGDGGDEIFGGYTRFVAGIAGEHMPEHLRHAASRVAARVGARFSDGATTTRDPAARAVRFAAGLDQSLSRRMLRWTSIFPMEVVQNASLASVTLDELAAFSDASFAAEPQGSPLARILHNNFTTYLPEDLLVKVDRCSMAVSLETRSPLLDSGLIDFMGRLPDSWKVRGLTTKRILRETFSDLIAPEIRRRPKRGFGVPLQRWLDGPLKQGLHDAIRTDKAEIYRHFDRRTIERSVWSSPHLDATRAIRAFALWTLELWLRGS